METLIGMAAILGGIGGAVVSLVGVIGAVISVPDLFRVLRIVRARPVPVRQVTEGPAAVQGLIPVDAATGSALADGRPVVFGKLSVFEQVGKHTHERLRRVRSVPFELDDGKDRIRVDPDDAKVLSPLVLGGPINDAVRQAADGLFSWPNTPKHFFEEVLIPGDFVTVVGTVVGEGAERELTQAWIMRGEPRLMATTEARSMAYALAAIPGGALISGISWVVLQWSL